MARIHLIISPSPVITGTELKALCGRMIPNAQTLPVDVAEGKSTVMFCKNCFGPSAMWALPVEEKRNYVCAIVAGQESLTPHE